MNIPTDRLATGELVDLAEITNRLAGDDRLPRSIRRFYGDVCDGALTEACTRVIAWHAFVVSADAREITRAAAQDQP